MNQVVANLAQRVLDGQQLDCADGAVLSRLDGMDLYDLFYWANRIRVAFMGPDVKFCAIVAAKVGGCSEDCKFCAQSEHYDTAIEGQSRLTDEQLSQRALRVFLRNLRGSNAERDNPEKDRCSPDSDHQPVRLP